MSASAGFRGTSPLAWTLPAITLQAALAAALGPAWMPSMTPVHAFGALLLVGGGGWLIRAGAHELAWNATPVCGGTPARALVVTGPYRRLRHPMYAGAVALLGGVALALASPAAALVAAAYGVWLHLAHVRAEEARLHARFGSAWRAYAALTRRWL